MGNEHWHTSSQLFDFSYKDAHTLTVCVCVCVKTRAHNQRYFMPSLAFCGAAFSDWLRKKKRELQAIWRISFCCFCHTQTHKNTHTHMLRLNAEVLIEASGWHGNPKAASFLLCDISILKTATCVCVLDTFIPPVWATVMSLCRLHQYVLRPQITDELWHRSPRNEEKKKVMPWIIGRDESVTTKSTHNMELAENVGKFLDQLHF